MSHEENDKYYDWIKDLIAEYGECRDCENVPVMPINDDKLYFACIKCKQTYNKYGEEINL